MGTCGTKRSILKKANWQESGISASATARSSRPTGGSSTTTATGWEHRFRFFLQKINNCIFEAVIQYQMTPFYVHIVDDRTTTYIQGASATTKATISGLLLFEHN